MNGIVYETRIISFANQRIGQWPIVSSIDNALRCVYTTKMTEIQLPPPTDRELRLANAAIRLLTLLRPAPPNVVLSDSIEARLDELDAALVLYKAEMLHPDMEQHTLIPLKIVRFAYPCDGCDTGFATYTELTKHQQEHHPDRKPPYDWWNNK